MERLTMTSDKGGVAFTFDLDITCKPSEAQKILKLAQKLKEYEDIEEKITKKFAGCIDIKTILDSFCAFYDMQETNEELAQCTLLTNEDVLKYRQWKEAEEQGLLLRLPCKVGDEVFVLDNRHKIIHPFEVKNIHLNKYELNFRISYIGTEPCLQYWEIGCCNSKLGETVFLTKEEAEEALARMEGENGKVN